MNFFKLPFDVLQLLYFAQMLGVFIMSLYIGYGTIFKFRFSFIAFVTGFIITRVSLMIMYGLVLLFYQGQGRLHIWVLIPPSAALAFDAMWHIYTYVLTERTRSHVT